MYKFNKQVILSAMSRFLRFLIINIINGAFGINLIAPYICMLTHLAQKIIINRQNNYV